VELHSDYARIFNIYLSIVGLLMKRLGIKRSENNCSVFWFVVKIKARMHVFEDNDTHQRSLPIEMGEVMLLFSPCKRGFVTEITCGAA
jgi:hypothetical protein